MLTLPIFLLHSLLLTLESYRDTGATPTNLCRSILLVISNVPTNRTPNLSPHWTICACRRTKTHSYRDSPNKSSHVWPHITRSTMQSEDSCQDLTPSSLQPPRRLQPLLLRLHWPTPGVPQTAVMLRVARHRPRYGDWRWTSL